MSVGTDSPQRASQSEGSSLLPLFLSTVGPASTCKSVRGFKSNPVLVNIGTHLNLQVSLRIQVYYPCSCQQWDSPQLASQSEESSLLPLFLSTVGLASTCKSVRGFKSTTPVLVNSGTRLNLQVSQRIQVYYPCSCQQWDSPQLASQSEDSSLTLFLSTVGLASTCKSVRGFKSTTPVLVNKGEEQLC